MLVIVASLQAQVFSSTYVCTGSRVKERGNGNVGATFVERGKGWFSALPHAVLYSTSPSKRSIPS